MFSTIISLLKKLLVKEAPVSEEALERQNKIISALAVVLVDIALVDNEFGYDEHDFILTYFTREYGLSKTEIYGLIEKAKEVIASEKDIDNYGRVLHDELSIEERESLMAAIDELLHSDSEKDRYEELLRARYEKLLGVRVKPLV